VLEAGSVEEAIRSLEQHPVDVVVTSLDLASNGGSSLISAMRSHPQWESIPVLALADSAVQFQPAAMAAEGYQDCQTRFDREAMLDSIARLAAALAPAAEAVPSEW
jgi:CheY-like chemotaxis protein